MPACRATPTFPIFYILDFRSFFHKLLKEILKKFEKNYFTINFWGWKSKNIVFLLYSWYAHVARPHFQNFNFTEICLHDGHFPKRYSKIQKIGYKAPIIGLKSHFYSIFHFFDFTGSSLNSLENTDISIFIKLFLHFLIFFIVSFNIWEKKIIS